MTKKTTGGKMTGRFLVVVLDGFGIGAMEDVAEVRPQDTGANTLASLFKVRPGLYLPNLERLGLMNAFGRESANMCFSPSAAWGRCSLMHQGADSFWGHQEIMGTRPPHPKEIPFASVADEVAGALRKAGHEVGFRGAGGALHLLVVDGCVVVADNLEADPGQNYNVLGALSAVAFERVLKIGRIVRDVVEVSRVICCGNPSVGMDRIVASTEERDGYIGVSSPRSGLYGDGYRCVPMGSGVDPSGQAPFLLTERGVPVFLFGKVADIVENYRGRSVPWIDTDEVLCMTLGAFETLDRGFICTNVQGTDLAGHREDAEDYVRQLEAADLWIGRIMERTTPDDVLLVMADHGNDPGAGHSRHTRERVPLLLYAPLLHASRIEGIELGERRTLSDIGATVTACFGAGRVENPEARPLEALKRFWKR
ncbi:MAG: phosphopentomutase [Synergistaceae bacterium]|jgi:phosphopentomutase|nr:phosphopentomutase [Synergistaceae bacterium]